MIRRHSGICLTLAVLGLVAAGCGGKKDNPNLVRVRIEQFIVKPIPSAEETAVAEEQARQVLAQVRAGVNFDSLAEKYSTRAGSSRGDRLTLTAGWMGQAFDDTVFAMRDGTVSDIIRTPATLYIVARDSSQYLQIRSSHILIKADTAKATGNKEQIDKTAREKAWDLYRRLQKGGNFYDLAKEFSEDPGSKENGGDIGWTKRNALVREYENVAFNQEPGIVSEPVHSRFGYHLIRTVKKKDLSLSLRVIEFKVPVNEQDKARARTLARQAQKMALSGVALKDLAERLGGESPDGLFSYLEPYEVRRNLLLPEIAAMLDKMDTGDITKVIEGDTGMYFIRLVERK
jgi:parvulin-like peptidyl-prolyl isomerase